MQAGSRPQSRPATTASPNPRPAQPQYQVNTQTKVIDTNHGRLLCIADIRGRLSALNDLAREVNAKAIIHTGDFGFFGECSVLFLRVHGSVAFGCLASIRNADVMLWL
jgi:hypothetical protein